MSTTPKIRRPTSPTTMQSPRVSARPPLDHSSVRAYLGSLWARFSSIWTRRFVYSLIAGQVVSLCITCTNVTTTELVARNWSLPTTQTFFLYFALFVIYTPYTIYRYGFVGWLKMIYKDGWKYFILAAADVEGNFLVVKAYEYTTLLSCMLLDAWAIPVCLLFSWIYMRPKYHWTQLLGVFVCVAGLGLLVASDEITDKDWPALSRAKGDIFMLVGASLYGFTNATEEFFVRRSPLYEVVGQLGMWGVLINGIQAAALEHKDMTTASWNGATIGLLVAYTAAMLILYTVAPVLYRMASSAYYNLSLLSSDFYGLLFGLFLYHYKVYWLYFPAFVIVISGLVIYFWHATPEEQGKIDPRAPAYVHQREGPNVIAGQV
ncbi:solute carrier family 35 member SLC35F1/F2/F6 [Epithele typhae]|uniref:solute carrier family 35 member SLC35F1/F2/F6 n=1 Tax=Epithele typhae TaxID=378194 RepID=UPI002008BEDA|nr:solute carrier family 35 member SLC35F1/F2/F6 [Epithele typhae]KAH9935919.1 solute carrier family 35 member SLC35F1/F2/F6 [Epithele typhae]